MVAITVENVRKAGLGLGALVLLFLAAFPLLWADQGLHRMLMMAFVWTGFASAWNIFSGYSGYLSLGHSMFFGVGGLTSTFLLAWYEVSPWIGIVAGVILAMLVAVVIGLVLFRLDDIYFALAMLAVPFATIPVLVWLGIIEVSVPFRPDQAHYFMSYREITPYYYMAFVAMVATIAISWWVKRNRLGYYLRAIKGSEEASQSLGIDTQRYEIYALTLSAGLSAIFGTLFVQANFIMTPESIFGIHPIIQSVVLPIAGGVGTVFGPVVGGLTLFPIQETLRAEYGDVIPGIHNLVFGLIVIAVILLLPEGIYTSIRNRVFAWARRHEAQAETTADAPGGMTDAEPTADTTGGSDDE